MNDHIEQKSTASENARPLVSLVILAFNQEKYIANAIESALLQTYTPMEIIVSDDCSKDGTYQVAERVISEYRGPHKTILNRNTPNLGLAGNINKVLELSSGEIVCWAGGDDISLPGKIEELVAPMISNTEIVATHSYVNEIDEEGNFIKIRTLQFPEEINSPHEVILKRLRIISQSHAFRKSVVHTFGPLNATVTNESSVMAFREACLGKIVLVKKPLTNYRIGSGVSTQRGKTVEQLSVREPIKYAGWWASAYNQIAKDAITIGLGPELINLAQKHKELYENVYQANLKPFNFKALSNSTFKKGFFAVLKAFARRNTPNIILSFLYRMRKWI